MLDTHAFVWWAAKPTRVGRAAARALAGVDRGDARAYIPAIVGVELTLLQEAGRKLPSVAELEAATVRNDRVVVLPLDVRQASEFALLAVLEDPFDRMIVAAARALNRPLLTADSTITDSNLVPVIWD